MIASELRKKFIEFFVEKGHKEIPSSFLIPENDPSVLFTTAGMHPLVPYLLGESHPLGKKLCSVQKCLRTDDIDNVGDGFHHTFFEMLGNWSLGDYWKDQMVSWSFEFLTKVLNISAEKISVTCFTGDADAPRDEESAVLWKKAGIPEERIYFLPKEDNWWGPAGKTGPCGPDSEMFFDTGKEKCGPDCKPGCGCGKYIEIWNDVFMQYNKQLKVQSEKLKVDGGEEYEFVVLKQKNIDTGMGVERTTAVTSGFMDDNYKTELFWPIIQKIEEISGKKYEGNEKPMRIIADHIRASVFLIADGITPSNTEQGYVLRRLIRRAIRFGKMLGVEKNFTSEVAGEVVKIMEGVYPELRENWEKIKEELEKEEERFSKTLATGLKEFSKFYDKNKNLCGADAFYLYESYGFPYELTCELATEKGCFINKEEYEKALEAHQQKSRTGAEKKFKGGLADQSEITTKYHTATHLLHRALREVLGDHVQQAGSNITAERLRFDFTHPEKLTDEQLKKVEDMINEKVKENLPVCMEIMTLKEAKNNGALAFFEQKYGEQVKVYSIGPSMDSTSSPQASSRLPFSMEVCGGPHVNSTGEIGGIKIIKEESNGAGKRRIYAVINANIKYQKSKPS